MGSLILPMFHHILTRGESGGLSKEVLRGPRVEGSVIYLGGGLDVVFIRAISKKAKKARKRKKKTRVQKRVMA